ncbi:MAG: hypothetical protein ABIZ81_08855 [Opitutaceae bacterium]
MEIFCPECLGALVITEGDRARCTVHGGFYRVLFRRITPSATNSPIPLESVTATTTHAGSAMPPPLPIIPPLPETAARSAAVYCARHPSTTATARCDSCGTLMCANCNLILDGNTHVCPACAAAWSEAPNAKRPASVIWSLAFAGWCTVGLVALLVAASMTKLDIEQGGKLVRGLCTFGIIVPAIAGFALGLNAIKRREKTSALAWVATLWNGILLLILLLALVMGFSMQAR